MGDPDVSQIIKPELKMVAWELTRACNLRCAHCRASADKAFDPEALTLDQCLDIVCQITEVSKPVIILTGGEPLLSDNVYAIARFGVNKGLRMVLGTNGTLITPEVASDIKAAGITAVGISIDYPVASHQDEFRGVKGAFDQAINGMRNALNAGVSVQVNTTVTRLNVKYLDELLRLAVDSGARAFHPFLLVPTGRGEDLRGFELSSREYENVLNWVYDKQVEYRERLFIKPTDAPHYMRIVAQRKQSAGNENVPKGIHTGSISRGCLAGTGFCFISHTGIVQGCGYLNVPAGDLKNQSFKEIWQDSVLFNDLRNLSRLKGKCGDCEYKRICGGCRARAYEATGDYLESEPYCLHQPSTCQVRF